MRTKEGITLEVLSQQLGEVVGDRRIRSAVFTTFSFDPGFFELHILPVVFPGQTFSQVDKVRRIQLEEALRGVDHLAVYYDRGALSQDAEPASLDYRRIDLRRTAGSFHPKVILLLVDDFLEEGGESKVAPPQSLIVSVSSANLTRAGWWENVECCHIEEIKDRDFGEDRCAFRRDLLSLIRRIREDAGEAENHGALDAAHAFLLNRAPKEEPAYASKGGRYYTRLFCGQQGMTFSKWLEDLRLGKHEWNFEVVSPFFDKTGAGPLEAIVNAMGPKEVRVYLPRDADGAAKVTPETYDAVAEWAWWGRLPSEVTDRGRDRQGEKLLPRRVHAKAYRLWNFKDGREVLIVGSVNLTSAAHSHGGSGNLEAAFLVDVSERGGGRRWWLESLEVDPERYAEQQPTEEEGLEDVPIDLSLRYDWAAERLDYWLEGAERGRIEICETNGTLLFNIDTPRLGRWVDCGSAEAAKVREKLRSSSFLLVRHQKGAWRILVREENMGFRPSLLLQLTPEEILEYWSLLTQEQKAEWLEERVGKGETLEGLDLVRNKIVSRNTLFDRFAGIFHAFGCLGRYIEEAINEGRHDDAAARLGGAKYDSLPVLLEKTLSRECADPVISYVTFLCAKQLRRGLRKRHRAFFRERKGQLNRLDTLLEKVPEVRRQLSLSGREGRKFLAWYEEMFLLEV